MDAGIARSQQTQVATVLYTLTTLALCLGAMLFMHAAGERARVQDENRIWQALASRYLQENDIPDRWKGPSSLRIASIELTADARAGTQLKSWSLDSLRPRDVAQFSNAANAAGQIDCLAEAVYYESRSEAMVGQLAVAEVIMNRVQHSAYPDSICGVVYQGSERRTGCQFSFTCDGSMGRLPRGGAWRRSLMIAEYAFLGFGLEVTRRATHYHTTAVDPVWSSSLIQTRRIGTHIFYRGATRREVSAGLVERGA